MKIIWSDFASQMLKEIFVYYKENASTSVAKNIRNDIFKTTNKLQYHPQLGQIELNLIQLKEGHRYLVEGNYKIVYFHKRFN
jgi:plasmid stabilization system protein ParE